MNPSKTVFTLLGTQRAVKENSDFFFEMSDLKFTPSKKIKVLGVLIDQALTWESHVSLVVRRCTGTLVSLYRFRRHFTSEALLAIIRAHVFSHIYYRVSGGSPAMWGTPPYPLFSKIWDK